MKQVDHISVFKKASLHHSDFDDMVWGTNRTHNTGDKSIKQGKAEYNRRIFFSKAWRLLISLAAIANRF